MPRKISSASTPAAGSAFTPSPRGRSARCSNNFSASPKSEGLDTKPREVKDEALQKCILIGFSDRVARRLDQGTLRCELVHNRRGVLARESAVAHSELFVAAEVREVEGREVNTILSLATAIEPDWLREFFPERHRNPTCTSNSMRSRNAFWPPSC